ncbi:hypothetical protein [Streptomyces sp. SID12501]|uniref:Uncharacterized protein n=1 Tax=Streptomyces sp. SID12501 TaxID=2706042 RepID=A0A6B3BZX5_9ACTN|nr:hypothetical protein [Streptomyces sp. SID12501]NEC89766.1 hypothetical protein [Streptomyces sp. SID12501]
MTHDMDLNEAATRLESHIRDWRAEGLQVSDGLWAADVTALEVRITSPAWAGQLVVQLYGAGRAHVFLLVKAGFVQERHRVSSLDAWSALLTESVARASRVRLVQARLLTSTCTTGWLDWIHGELWLLPEGLLRIRSGFMTTVANSYSSGSGPTARDPYRLIAHDPATVLAAHPTNKLIPFAEMATARLHGGVTTSGLEVVMTDGTRHKLLWASWDPARRLLRERLLPLLGARLTH